MESEEVSITPAFRQGRATFMGYVKQQQHPTSKKEPKKEDKKKEEKTKEEEEEKEKEKKGRKEEGEEEKEYPGPGEKAYARYPPKE